MSFDLTLPDEAEAETFMITGGLVSQPTNRSNIAYEATINTSGNNFTVVPSVVRVEGLPGSVHKGEFMVIPDQGYVLAEGDVSSVSNDTDFALGADRNSGNGVAIPYTLTLPSAQILRLLR